MTNEELKAAIELFSYIEEIAKEMPDNPYAKSQYNVLLAARELYQLKNGTHTDMVIVPKKPTEEMLDAFDELFSEGEYIEECYKSMIAAAPKGGA